MWGTVVAHLDRTVKRFGVFDVADVVLVVIFPNSSLQEIAQEPVLPPAAARHHQRAALRLAEPPPRHLALLRRLVVRLPLPLLVPGLLRRLRLLLL